MMQSPYSNIASNGCLSGSLTTEPLDIYRQLHINTLYNAIDTFTVSYKVLIGKYALEQVWMLCEMSILIY